MDVCLSDLLLKLPVDQTSAAVPWIVRRPSPPSNVRVMIGLEHVRLHLAPSDVGLAVIPGGQQSGHPRRPDTLIPVKVFRAVSLLCVLCVELACNSSGGTVKRLSIATGGTGGVYYPYGGGIAKIISENIPGVQATAEVTAASVDNLKFLQDGRSDLAFTMADTVEDAAQARGAFQSTGAVPARALAVLYPNYLHLVTRADTGLTKLTDLKGRVVSTGAPGSGTEVVAFRALEAVGINPKTDLTTQALGASQSVDALKDSKLDAFFFTGGLPTAAVLDFANTPGIKARLIASDTALPQMRARYGDSTYFPLTIPKATYGTDEDVTVVGVANILVVSEKMADDLAYDITRLLFEKQPELIAIHPQAKDLSLPTAVAGSPVPFHPGAIRYYTEKHAWKP
jgi:TRAP transporter TAXI family solute receptor